MFLTTKKKKKKDIGKVAGKWKYKVTWKRFPALSKKVNRQNVPVK